MHRRQLLFLASTIAFAAACSSNSTGSGGTNDGNNNQYNNATGTMTASIGGTSWTANFLTHASFSGGTLSITGESYNGNSTQTRTITMAFANVSQAGTFTLSTPGDGHGGNAIMTLGGSNDWFTASTGGTGSVVVTALDGTHVAGTFEFVAIGAGSIGNATVTNGSFNIPF